MQANRFEYTAARGTRGTASALRSNAIVVEFCSRVCSERRPTKRAPAFELHPDTPRKLFRITAQACKRQERQPRRRARDRRKRSKRISCFPFADCGGLPRRCVVRIEIPSCRHELPVTTQQCQFVSWKLSTLFGGPSERNSPFESAPWTPGAASAAACSPTEGGAVWKRVVVATCTKQ